MKLRKIIMLPLLASFLAGCSNRSIVGEYVFQMGKSNDTHFGIYLSLTDDIVYGEDGTAIGKGLTFEFAMSSGRKQIENNEYEKEIESMQSFAKGLLLLANEDEFPDESNIGNFYIDGYYYRNPEIIERDNEGSEIVKMGVKSIAFEDEKTGEVTITALDLPIDFVDKLVYNTYSGSDFVIVTPVSFEDVLFQLYWYGLDFNMETLEFEEVQVHPIGSVPTKQDIELINKTYPDKHMGRKYRSFYKLHMGLSRK